MRKRKSRAYRTYLFKKRMIEIIHLMLESGVCEVYCFFCGERFTPEDFPFDGRDKVEIHHISYVPEIKVLAHKICHRKHHRIERKKRARSK